MHRKFFYWGNSMRRVFQPGDEVCCDPVDFGDVKNGDVIVFRSETEMLVIHRVISVAPGAIRTMGDNNPKPDEEILTPEVPLLAARSFRRRSRAVPVRNGWRGRVQFARNRLARRLDALARRCGRLLLIPALERWKIRRLTPVCFGKQSFFYWHNLLIATWDGTRLQFRHPVYRLFFAPDSGEGGKKEVVKDA